MAGRPLTAPASHCGAAVASSCEALWKEPDWSFQAITPPLLLVTIPASARSQSFRWEAAGRDTGWAEVTVMLTGADVAARPRLSVATAVRVKVPAAAGRLTEVANGGP